MQLGAIRARVRRAGALLRCAVCDPRRRGIPLRFVKPCYWVVEALSPRSVVVDMGLGFDADFSQALIERYGVRSHGFDPTRRHHPGLREIVEKSDGRFELHTEAIGAERGRAVFHESQENVSGSLFREHDNIRRDSVVSYEAPVIRVADALAAAGGRVDLVKMDIEGAEYSALDATADEVLSSVGQWVIEFHNDMLAEAPFSRVRGIVRRFGRLGFEYYTRDNVNFLFYRRGVAGLRVVFQQPALPRYRAPLFRELARRPGIRLKVFYGDVMGVPSVPADGFDAELTWMLRLPGWALIHPMQWTWATRRRTDVLVMAWNLHFVLLLPALLRARFSGVPTVLWGHGYSKHEVGWRRALREAAGTLATAVLLYNDRTRRRLVEAGWDAQRLFVALNALDQEPIQQARMQWLGETGRLEEFRRREGLEGREVLLFVSRLEPANRLDLLLEAAHRLKESRPGILVVIVGTGEDEPRLRDMAAALGIADRVRFTGAIYEEAQLAPWFLSADVYCYPSNIGLSLLHAFGYGLPVIASNNPELQGPEIEALRDGENGLLYADRDAESLAAAIRRLLEDRPLRQRMGEAALRTVLERFTLSNMADGFVAAIRYAAERGGR